MHEIPLIAISIDQLIASVIMGAIAVVGIVNYLGHIGGFKRIKKLLVLLVTLICGVIATPLVVPIVTAVFYTIALILAVATLAYDIVKDGIPTLVKSAFSNVEKRIDSAGSEPASTGTRGRS